MKRLLARILICIIAGVIMNVAVAWALALSINVYTKTKRTGFDATPESMFEVTRYDGFGSTVIWSTFGRPGPADLIQIGDPRQLIPEYSSHLQTATPAFVQGDRMHESHWVDARGLPMKSLQSAGFVSWDNIRKEGILAGIELQNSIWQTPGGFRQNKTLPTQIIWNGTIPNLVLYAMVMYTALFGLSDLRRFNRKRRGQCLKCGHQLLGEQVACPECGWRRT